MPRKRVGDGGATGLADSGVGTLAGWQAAGLALAAAGMAAIHGSGGLVAAVALAPMVYVFGRLRSHAVTSRSTADFIGAVLGERVGWGAAVVQGVGYLLLAVTFARSVGLVVVSELLQDPESAVNGWWWPLCSLLALMIAALLVYWAPVRLITGAAAVLVAAGVLVFFYLALAVAARVVAGTEPLRGGAGPVPALEMWTALIQLGLAMLGFEAVTTLNRRVGSLRRPLAAAVVVVAVAAAAVWMALAFGTRDAWGYHVEQFAVLVSAYYAQAGQYWALVGALAIGCAGLLAITLSGQRVAHDVMERLRPRAPNGAVAPPLVLVGAVLVVASCRGWLDVGSKLGYVGPLLLLVVYVLAAEANGRIPGGGAAAAAVRVWIPMVLAAVVVIPLLYYKFETAVLWPVVIAAGVVAAAAAIATRWRASPD